MADTEIKNTGIPKVRGNRAFMKARLQEITATKENYAAI
jgi:hypothetical protein